VSADSYLTTCWNCLGEFDALHAVWCSDDPKNPTKLCPFCFRCFCNASEKYKQEFWRRAPPPLVGELLTLSKSKDQLGDILIRLKKITTPQLLDALLEQKQTGKRLGEILTAKKLVSPEDVAAALQSQGMNPLTDTRGAPYSARPVWEQSSPEAIVQYILSLGAKKGASDVQIEPTKDAVAVKYRIDGFQFRVDPIPKNFQAAITQRLFEAFHLDLSREAKPQTSRSTGRLADGEFDLVTQTFPTPHGLAMSIKLINRASFLKDFATLGLELEDRVGLIERLRASFGLILVAAPAFNGAGTTAYSIMNFLLQGQRDVVSLESPVHWPMDGARQLEVETDSQGLRMEDALRMAMAIHPEVIILSSIPDPGTARVAAQLASSILVIGVVTARTAGEAVRGMLEMGVSPQLLSSSLLTVTCQRLVREICRICRVPADLPAAQTLGLHGIRPEEVATLHFFQGKGCPTCNKVGYRGRRALFEVLHNSNEIQSAIRRNLSADDFQSVAVASGMKDLRYRCLSLVKEGVTSFDEFARLRLDPRR